MNTINGYTCSCCGEYRNDLPFSYGTIAPAYYEYALANEREERFELSEDLCVMDNENYFIRGCIEIPVIGTEQKFIWVAWVSLSIANFEKAQEYWDRQELLEPMFGWFSSVLPCYPDTLNLMAKIHYRQGISPYIELEPTEHPLAVEMIDGITVERVQEIAEGFCENNKGHLWPADDLQNVAVITLEKILNRESPVLYVTHDAEDGMWQFLDGDEVNVEDARLLSLMEMVNLDSSLAQLFDLPQGWMAWRDNEESKWFREPK